MQASMPGMISFARYGPCEQHLWQFAPWHVMSGEMNENMGLEVTVKNTKIYIPTPLD